MNWEDDALCGENTHHLFFSFKTKEIARAKEICRHCPALVPCLTSALEGREPWGVWGGQLFMNGKVVSAKRDPGRPSHGAEPVPLPVVAIPQPLRDLMVFRETG